MASSRMSLAQQEGSLFFRKYIYMDPSSSWSYTLSLSKNWPLNTQVSPVPGLMNPPLRPTAPLQLLVLKPIHVHTDRHVHYGSLQ